MYDPTHRYLASIALRTLSARRGAEAIWTGSEVLVYTPIADETSSGR